MKRTEDSIKIDLHMHSTASDGAFDVEYLLGLLGTQKTKIAAITDHDWLTLPELPKTFYRHPLLLIPGVEISAHTGALNFHLLCYFPALARCSADEVDIGPVTFTFRYEEERARDFQASAPFQAFYRLLCGIRKDRLQRAVKLVGTDAAMRILAHCHSICRGHLTGVRKAGYAHASLAHQAAIADPALTESYAVVEQFETAENAAEGAESDFQATAVPPDFGGADVDAIASALEGLNCKLALAHPWRCTGAENAAGIIDSALQERFGKRYLGYEHCIAVGDAGRGPVGTDFHQRGRPGRMVGSRRAAAVIKALFDMAD